MKKLFAILLITLGFIIGTKLAAQPVINITGDATFTLIKDGGSSYNTYRGTDDLIIFFNQPVNVTSLDSDAGTISCEALTSEADGTFTARNTTLEKVVMLYCSFPGLGCVDPVINVETVPITPDFTAADTTNAFNHGYNEGYDAGANSCTQTKINTLENIKVSVYPNPASSMINISCENFDYVEIYNNTGQLVKTEMFEEIYVGDLEGVYIFHIYNFEGNKAVEKVIIE